MSSTRVTLLTRLTLLTVAFVTAASGCSDSAAPPGPPATIRLISAASLTSVAGDTLTPIQVEVRDSSGYAVPGVPIYAFGSANPGPYRGGTSTAATIVDSAIRTDARGRATVRVVAPTYAGPGTIELGIDATAAPATGLVNGTVHVGFTTSPGPFSQFYFTMSDYRFVGAPVLVDALFVPVDRFGNPVSWPAVQWSANNGWVIRGDTAVPPSTTGEGATAVTVTAGSVTAQRGVALVTDLRRYRWSLQWKCASSAADVAAGGPDSVVASGTNGVAYYPGDPGYKPIVVSANVTQPALEFSFAGTITSYRNGTATSADIMGGEPYNWDAYAQRPDTVVFGVDSYARALVRRSGALPGYVSPTAWCSGATLQGVTLQAY